MSTEAELLQTYKNLITEIAELQQAYQILGVQIAEVTDRFHEALALQRVVLEKKAGDDHE